MIGKNVTKHLVASFLALGGILSLACSQETPSGSGAGGSDARIRKVSAAQDDPGCAFPTTVDGSQSSPYNALNCYNWGVDNLPVKVATPNSSCTEASVYELYPVPCPQGGCTISPRLTATTPATDKTGCNEMSESLIVEGMKATPNGPQFEPVSSALASFAWDDQAGTCVLGAWTNQAVFHIDTSPYIGLRVTGEVDLTLKGSPLPWGSQLTLVGDSCIQ